MTQMAQLYMWCTESPVSHFQAQPSRKHKFAAGLTAFTCSPQTGTVLWASSWLRMKTLPIDRALKLTPLLHTPRRTNPPNYFPLWSLGGNQRLEEEIEVKNKHRLTSASYSLCRRCTFHIRRSVSQRWQVEPFRERSARERGDITAHFIRARYISRQIVRVWAGGLELRLLMRLPRPLRAEQPLQDQIVPQHFNKVYHPVDKMNYIYCAVAWPPIMPH